jgi:hypothetical protein
MPALPEESGHVADECSTRNGSSDWTSYSAGESTTDRVMQAAENPATLPDILSLLADSCNLEVRMAVADNKNTLLETMMMLAQDESADLRYQLAESHNIHYSVLKVLAKDSNPFVADRAQRTLARLIGGAVIILKPQQASKPLEAVVVVMR